MTEAEAIVTLSKLRLSANARKLMEALIRIDNVWMNLSFCDIDIEEACDDKSLRLTNDECMKCLDELEQSGLLSNDSFLMNYGLAVYFIKIRRFLELRRMPSQTRTREEVKEMLKLVDSN